jgi:hypothetical protein
MRSANGQATIDYVALVAVLAIVFGLAVGVAPVGAAGIVNAVTGQIRHALCLVGGGPCVVTRAKPCVLASTRDLHHFAVSAFIVRIDHDRYVLRETMSDGTVRLTVGRGGAAGLQLAAGATARASVQGREMGAADELRAAAQLTLGWGKVYVARDAHEADAFMRAIKDGDSPAPEREQFIDGGARGLAEAGIASGALEGLLGHTVGARRDLRTGEVTVALSSAGAGWGALLAAIGGPAGSADHTMTLGLMLDRRHRPRELSLSAVGTLSAGVPLAVRRALRGASGNGLGGDLAGRRWELAARLDLRDPQVRAAWSRFRAHPASGEAIGALARTIRDRAYLDVRTFGTEASANGGAAGIAGGVRFGAEYDHLVDRARLLAASSRPPGGLWERRLDCVPA